MLPGPDHRCVPHRLHQVVDLAAGVYAVAVIMSGLLRQDHHV